MTSRDQHSGFSLSKSISQIPNFDRNPDKLPLFGAVVRKILHRFPNNEEDILFGLANKLTGGTVDGYLTIVHQYNSVERLLSDLMTQYGNIGFADDIGESIGDYGLRIQKLLNQLTTIYSPSPTYTPRKERSVITQPSETLSNISN